MHQFTIFTSWGEHLVHLSQPQTAVETVPAVYRALDRLDLDVEDVREILPKELHQAFLNSLPRN